MTKLKHLLHQAMIQFDKYRKILSDNGEEFSEEEFEEIREFLFNNLKFVSEAYKMIGNDEEI